MTELFEDIETLQSILIAFEEGASDERRMAREQLRNMIERKQRTIDTFESYFESEDLFENMPV